MLHSIIRRSSDNLWEVRDEEFPRKYQQFPSFKVGIQQLRIAPQYHIKCVYIYIYIDRGSDTNTQY